MKIKNFKANHLDTIFERPYNCNVFKITHINGRTYYRGNTFKSLHVNLVKIFGNHYQRHTFQEHELQTRRCCLLSKENHFMLEKLSQISKIKLKKDAI